MRNILIGALAALSACTSASLTTGDQRRAVALAPFNRAAGLGQITVPEGTIFYPGQVQGQAAWCSGRPVYFAWMEAKAACFTDPAGADQAEGWFKEVVVLQPMAAWRFDVDVPYRVAAGPALPPRR